MFRVATNAPMTHYPDERRRAAITETVAGRTDFIFAAYAAAGEMMNAGKLKPIAVAAKNARDRSRRANAAGVGINNVDFGHLVRFLRPRRAEGNRHPPEWRDPEAVVHPGHGEGVDHFKIEPMPRHTGRARRLVVDEIARYRDIVNRIGAKID